MRIIPISSGKGGVGKTTLALNYALSLSRHGRTVLVDLDTGTSSIRNCIDTPVSRDLYHFFKKGAALRDCVTSLAAHLDPRGEYSNFGFVAGPRHLIEDISNFGRDRRDQLMEAVNGLEADYVVLDLRAGLDQGVIDFLPHHNSGILVFTPHMPAATLAASDIVKAILFRRLRRTFDPAAAIYGELRELSAALVNAAIDRAEDVYDESVPNLDAFLDELRQALGDGHRAVRIVQERLESFAVYFVLNLFDGVKDSYDTAVRPFVANLGEHVSSRLAILNLGWVVAHEDVNRASQQRVPVLLMRGGETGTHPAPDRVAAELQALASRYLAHPAPSRLAETPARRGHTRPPGPEVSRYLEVQLDTLVKMQDDLSGAGYRDNFKYIAYRSLHLMHSRGPREFGDTRLLKERWRHRASDTGGAAPD